MTLAGRGTRPTSPRTPVQGCHSRSRVRGNDLRVRAVSSRRCFEVGHGVREAHGVWEERARRPTRQCTVVKHDVPRRPARDRYVTWDHTPPIPPSCPSRFHAHAQSNVSTTHTTPLRAHPRHKGSMGRGKRKKYGGDAEKDKLDGLTQARRAQRWQHHGSSLLGLLSVRVQCGARVEAKTHSLLQQNRTELKSYCPQRRTEQNSTSRRACL